VDSIFFADAGKKPSGLPSLNGRFNFKRAIASKVKPLFLDPQKNANLIFNEFLRE